MQVQPYLFYNGRCEEALNFYRTALGANIEALMRFSESPEPTMIPPGAEQKIMHANFRIGETQIMASDGQCNGAEQSNFQGFTLTITAPSVAEAERLFTAIGEGGQVQMPLTKTFFAERFGMVADRFGVSWMLLAN